MLEPLRSPRRALHARVCSGAGIASQSSVRVSSSLRVETTVMRVFVGGAAGTELSPFHVERLAEPRTVLVTMLWQLVRPVLPANPRSGECFAPRCHRPSPVCAIRSVPGLVSVSHDGAVLWSMSRGRRVLRRNGL